MRINELRLDNFGRFRQTIIGPVSDWVTVFYGPNESGKSTLLASSAVCFSAFRSSITPNTTRPCPAVTADALRCPVTAEFMS